MSEPIRTCGILTQDALDKYLDSEGTEDSLQPDKIFVSRSHYEKLPIKLQQYCVVYNTE